MTQYELSGAPAPPLVPPPAPAGAGSWAARYGQLLLTDGVAPLPTALFYYQGRLDLSAAEVWLTTAALASRPAGPWPVLRLNQLAAETGIAIRTLQYQRARLEARGYLVTRPQYDSGRGGQVSNRYDFAGLFAALEAAVAADPRGVRGGADPDGAPSLAEYAGAAALSDLPDPDGSFLARYGRLIARVGIAAVPRALFRYQGRLALSAQQVWFISYILAHRWTTALPYPSLSRMAERTGYSRRQLQVLKEELVDAGYLSLVRRQDPSGGQDSNAYDFSPLLAALEAGLQQPPTLTILPLPVPPAGAAAAPNQPRRGRRRVQETTQGGVQADSGGPGGARPSAQLAPTGDPPVQETTQGGVQQTTQGRVQGATPGARDDTGGGAERITDPGARGITGPGARGFTRKESYQEERINRDDSNHGADSKSSAPDSPAHRYSPYVAGVILDHSRELGDTPHGPANVTQAHRLWTTSGLDENAFVALLQEARLQVRLYQGKQGHGTIANKMGYYFRVVRSRLGVPPGEERR